MDAEMLMPYRIDPAWKIESGEPCRKLCRGCGKKLEPEGYGYDVRHKLLECLEELQRRIAEK